MMGLTAVKPYLEVARVLVFHALAFLLAKHRIEVVQNPSVVRVVISRGSLAFRR